MTRGKAFVFLTGLFLCFLWAAISPCPSSANPEYARATGKTCMNCHGGGETMQKSVFGRPLVHENFQRRFRPGRKATGFFPFPAGQGLSLAEAGCSLAVIIGLFFTRLGHPATGK